MQALNKFETKTYDPRWFIWTMVFLIASGVSLVSYIIITGSQDAANIPLVSVQHILRK
jgi:hypothetical protein